MKKLFFISIAALFLAAGAAHAGPQLRELEPAGYVCEGGVLGGHATLFFDTKEASVYWQINGRNIVKESIETYWYQNKFGHTVGSPPFYLIRACWGTRQHAINTHQPAEFEGATDRHFNWGREGGKFDVSVWKWHPQSRTMVAFPQFIGVCIEDYETGAELREKFIG